MLPSIEIILNYFSLYGMRPHMVALNRIDRKYSTRLSKIKTRFQNKSKIKERNGMITGR